MSSKVDIYYIVYNNSEYMQVKKTAVLNVLLLLIVLLLKLITAILSDFIITCIWRVVYHKRYLYKISVSITNF